MKKIIIIILLFWSATSFGQGIIPGYNFIPHYTTSARPAAATYNKYCVIFNDDSIGSNPIQVSTGAAWVTLGAATGGGSGFSNPMSAVNDMIFGGTAGAATRLPAPAHNGMKLSSTGGTLGWQDTTASGGISGLTTNFIPYATSATSLGNSTAFYDGTEFRITNVAGTRASHFYSSGSNIFLRAAIVALADSDVSAYTGIGTTTQLNSAKLNVTGVSSLNGALWLGNATSAGFRFLQNSTLMRFDCETTNEDITFTTGLVAKNNLFLSHTGNSIFNNTAENGTAILQSQSNSTTQLALHYDASNYGQVIVNSTGSWGWRHMAGFTLPAIALAAGSSADSVLAVRTSASGIDTLVKILQPSSGITTVGAFSGSSQTNGASISGATLTFGPADATNPGMVSTGTQTWAGTKIFNTGPQVPTQSLGTNSALAASTGYVDGSLGVGHAVKYLHTIFTPTTGGTVNTVNGQYNIINPAGALLALTINLPSSPNDNDVVLIKFTQTITTVTYANGTVVDGITGPAAGAFVILTYDGGTTSWY